MEENKHCCTGGITQTKITLEEGMIHCLVMLGVACTLLDSMSAQIGTEACTEEFISSSCDACKVIFRHIHTGLCASGCAEKITAIHINERACKIIKGLEGITALNCAEMDGYIADMKARYEHG